MGHGSRGSERGFVGHVWEHRPDESLDDRRVIHNLPGTPYDEDLEGLERRSRELMSGPPIHFEHRHAEVYWKQILETAGFRKWNVLAVAIMYNHFHIVVGVIGDPKPGKVLGDFKSWGTAHIEPGVWSDERRGLGGRSAARRRKLGDEEAVVAAVHYGTTTSRIHC